MSVEAVAFSDVDETLISVKSMFRFLGFRLRERGEPDGTYERLTGELREAARSGVPRTEINRRYYQLFKGEEAAALAASGRRWLAHEQEQQEQGGGSLFIPQVERALAGHRAAGEPVVLVSGSFFACLDPVAERVGAARAFGTRPLIRRGRLTGEVLFPLIGPAKGRIAHATAALLGVDLAGCTAYGDHISDLGLLEAVGRPVAVGEDAELGAHAEGAGWPRLRTGLVAAGI
ncbi:HAD-IB family hydrolase [Kitasatospora sp. NBC_00070]|uniref:HAD family hydrolase n=1 Tax=Kitasatospora sp. NBC_00070 TaxID=2975962 RepID=UPI003249F3F6